MHCNHSELQRFCQLGVNSVMATDVMDKDLKALRNARWNKAFAEQANHNMLELDNIDRKVTIVIEYLIRSSNVAHTMHIRACTASGTNTISVTRIGKGALPRTQSTTGTKFNSVSLTFISFGKEVEGLRCLWCLK
jgi:hypothetical protein